MNRTSLLLACAFFLHAESSDRDLASFTGELANGLVVHFAAAIEPPLQDSQILLLYNGVQDDHDRIHRSMQDQTTGVIIGYDIFAEPADAPDRFRVRIEPLTKAMTQGRIGLLVKYPPPQIVREGETIALDLLVSADGKQKLVDYIEVRRRMIPWTPKTDGPPHDFTLDDGPAALKLMGDTRFYMNGEPFPGRVAFTIMRTGATMWFAPPGRGRFILSLTPHEGFEKAGAIRDNVLSFQAGADRYEYRTTNSILGEGKTWNLYVLHDPLYQPKVVKDPTVFGGVDRLENLLPKR